MKYCFFIISIVFMISCHHQPVQMAREVVKTELQSIGSYGESPDVQQAVPASQLASLFSNSDTADAIISGDISASCRHSGCWMDLDMGNNATVHVTFKDERFTIPLDAAGKKAVVEGTAIRQMIPVETLRNYAREEGKNEEEVELITESAWTYEMVATGILIEE